jgi:predicted dehydrogenase
MAVIGLGGRAASMLEMIRQVEPAVQVTGLVDPAADGARGRLRDRQVPDEHLTVYDTIEAMLEDAGRYDGVLIGTRCHLHTPMAVAVAQVLARGRADLPLFLEKPVAIDEAQLAELAAAWEGREDRVLVSFPLRVTPLFSEVLTIIRGGRLGTVNQVQAFNDVSYGGTYFANWYRNHEQTGGLWLQKATHDLDYITEMVRAAAAVSASPGDPPIEPIAVTAMTSRTIYGGDKPDDLTCSACDEAETCIEGVPAQRRRGNSGGMGPLGPGADHACCFSTSIHHQDAGSLILMYDHGVHAAYSQNFVPRFNAGRRGARIVGHRASLEFDWCQEAITVYDHHTRRTDRIEVKVVGGHAGGDQVLARNFVDMMSGRAAGRADVRPLADLRDGLLSAAMCLAARQSSRTHSFQPIRVPGRSTPAQVTAPAILAD